MKKETVTCPEIKLVGISVRTNNAKEMKPGTGLIPECIGKYFSNGVAEGIDHRKNPQVTYCAYYDYENDHTGDYTFLIGEEVDSLETIPEGLTGCTIEAQNYIKHTSEPGPMPQVVINMWQQIWTQNLGAERSYKGDFELYDARAMDPQDTVVDIY